MAVRTALLWPNAPLWAFAPYIAVSSTLALALYRFYQWLLPKPIPGIPYNEASTKRLLGDLPEIAAYAKKTGRTRPYFAQLLAEHKTPIYQIFLVPFTKPYVVISDFRESQDMLLRRTKEIERGTRMSAIFEPITPDNHISFKTADPRFRRNRELLKDLMTPSFLNTVSAPEIYNKALSLVRLWSLKSQLANGAPFEARDDILDGALDIICAVSFALDDNKSTVQMQYDYLTSLGSLEPKEEDNGSVSFPRLPTGPEMIALRRLGKHMGDLMRSGKPSWTHKYIMWTDSGLPKAIATKNAFVSSQIDAAVERLKHDETTRTAMDYMLQREMKSAEKENRRPEFHSPHFHDELYGYINGGYDTTSTSLSWTLKLLADSQEWQSKLRSALRSAFKEAHDENRLPTVAELTKTNVPYLEATVEEIFRNQPPLNGVTREAIADTTVLGRPIPKGTQIFLLSTSVGYLFPEAPVADELRNESARDKSWGDKWNDDDVHLFKPERWLRKNEETGIEEFNSQAGPLMTFGMGIRGCFGRRLAYLEMKLVVALLVWSFEFQQLNKELSSYEAEDSLTTAPIFCYVQLKKTT